MNSLPLIGITTGDPKGIGPEVVARSLSDSEIQTLAQFKVFGSKIPRPTLSDEEAARQTYELLEEASEAALRGEVAALVTAPVNKARLRLVDKNFQGHTEFFQARALSDVCMMFVASRLRVSLVTRHIPLREVAARLSALDILRAIRLTHEGLIKHFKILKPKLVLCGLNPHAGEKGFLGDEETKIIRPALLQAKAEGIDVHGPFSADTLFWRLSQGEWDCGIAMYHDQGLIPVKTLAFKEAVQVTLGLPFLRVSVDHGTAEDLVGTGRADATNMKAAIRLACALVS